MKQKFEIKDVSDYKTIRKINVSSESQGLIIHPENTDTFDGNYSPIYLEFQNGVPVLYIWNDRNSQDPMKISLNEAMINNART